MITNVPNLNSLTQPFMTSNFTIHGQASVDLYGLRVYLCANNKYYVTVTKWLKFRLLVLEESL